jgi:N-acetylglutamate synthase-like GNAT family acetyltransferase
MELQRGDYVVTDDKTKVDLDRVHELLSASYWASGRSRETIETTVENSICFSVLSHDRQIGFARVVTDRAVFAWIADVIIHPDHRHRGVGRFLMECIAGHPEIPASLQVLRTRDAHGFYAELGFAAGEFMKK